MSVENMRANRNAIRKRFVDKLTEELWVRRGWVEEAESGEIMRDVREISRDDASSERAEGVGKICVLDVEESLNAFLHHIGQLIQSKAEYHLPT
jgi:hypothetical protein